MARHWILAALVATGVAETFEDTVNRVTAKVHDEVAPGFEVAEVMACHHNPARHRTSCENMEPPMKGLEDARYMRIVYFLPKRTRPSVMATVNLTAVPMTIDLHVHQRPFMEDQHTAVFPPPTLDFAGAVAKVQTAMNGDLNLYSVVWRRPLNPCVTEDLYQFMTGKDQEQFIISVGSVSHKSCVGFVTQNVKWCEAPICFNTIDEANQMLSVRNGTQAVSV